MMGNEKAGASPLAKTLSHMYNPKILLQYFPIDIDDCRICAIGEFCTGENVNSIVF